MHIIVLTLSTDQKDEALKKAKDFRANRIPKFLGYFERVLKGNEKNSEGKYLVGTKLTYADLTVWHVLSGYVHSITIRYEPTDCAFQTPFCFPQRDES